MLRKLGSGAIAKYDILLIAASVVLVIVAVLIIPYLTVSMSQSTIEKRRLIAVETNSIQRHTVDSSTGQPVTTYDQTHDFQYVKPEDLNPNSSVWVLYPFDNVVDAHYQKPLPL